MRMRTHSMNGVEMLTDRRVGRESSSERGQVLVEFVLVLPILLVLVVGIIEFGNAWRTSQMITNIAREGARLAVVPDSPDQAGVEQEVEDKITEAGLDVNRATVYAGVCKNCSGDPDTVTVDYQYDFIFFGPVMNLMLSGSGDEYGGITLSSTSIMRNE